MTFLSALLLLAAAPSPTAPPPVIATSSTARTEARALAQIVAPREIMVPLNVKWAKRAVLDMPKNNEDSRKLEADYPGIHAAMWAACEAELGRQMDADLPNLWVRLEKVYLSELDEKELFGLAHFYRTPTGQRMIKNLYANVDLNDAVATLAKTDDNGALERELDEASEVARQKTVAQLKIDPADLKILMESISIARMRAVGEKVQQTTSEWFNEKDPEGQKKLDTLMADAADRYVEEQEAKARRATK